jgi:GT2 family glycosyltransferase
MVKKFSGLTVKYIRSYPPSAVLQRKLGIQAVADDVTLIAIMDDDIELQPRAMEAMMNFWEKAEEDVAGASFHMVNHPELFASRLKSTTLAARSGLYSREKGIVLSSGFHTMVGSVKKNTLVEWLGLGAVVWRKTVFDNFSFDEWFRGYSYLEDLDFSYRVGKQFRLMIVADAGYYHYSSVSGRLNNYSFGKMEVLNRVYFVKKYPELSLIRCYFALGVRNLISLWMVFKERQPKYIFRVFGNLIGMVRAFFMLQ